MIFYHLSYQRPLETLVLTPRIPSNALKGLEDTHTLRVCLADSIDGCLAALQHNSGTYYVYEVEINEDDPDLHHPSVWEVFDSDITNEVWILRPIEVKFSCKIECHAYIDPEPIHTLFGVFDMKTYDWVKSNSL